MADKITKDDLFGDLNFNSEIKALKDMLDVITQFDAELKEISKNKLEEVLKIDASTVAGVKKFNEAKEQTNKIEKEKTELDKEALKLKKQLFEAEDAQVKARLRFQKATREQRKELSAQLVLEDKEAGTLQKVAARLTKLRAEREKLNLETKEGRKRLEEINEEIDKHNDFIRENSDNLKKQKINVGNYTDSIKEATGELGGLLGSIHDSIKAGKQQVKVFIAMAKGAETTKDKVKLLGKAFKSGGIGLIVGLLATVVKSFAGTRKGVLLFENTMKKVGATINVIGSQIRQAFTSASLSLQKLYKQGQLLTTFNPIERSKIKDSIEKLNGEIKENEENTLSFGDAWSKATSAITAYTTALFKLEDDQAKAQDLINKYTIEIEKLEEATGDMTLSFKEQQQAQQELIRLEAKRFEQVKKLATSDVDLKALQIRDQLLQQSKEYSIEQIKNLKFLEDEEDRLLIGSDAIKEFMEAKQALSEVEDENTLRLEKNAREARNTEKDKFEQQLDYAIDYAEAQKQITERIIKEEGTSLAERDKLTAEQRIRTEDAFKSQTDLVKDYTKQNIDFNALINASNEEEARKELDRYVLNETTQKRILEIIKERKIALQDLSEIEDETAKKRLEMQRAIAESQQNIEQDDFDLAIENMEAEFDKQKELGKESLAELKQRINDKRDLQIDQLKDEAAFELEALDNEIMEEEERAQKKKEIEEKLANNIARIKKEALSEEEALEKEALEKRKEFYNELKDAAFDTFEDILDAREERLKQELEDSRTAEDDLKDLAKERVLFADQSLAVEKAKQAEIQKELQKNERRRQILKTAETAMELLGSYAQGGSKTPFQDAFGDIVKMLNALKSVQFFAEGTESVEGGIQGKDSVPAMLMPKERVIDVDNNLKIGGMSNEQLADIAFKYRTGRLMDDLPSIKLESKRFESNQELINRVKGVEEAVKNIPVTSIDAHALSNYITETIRRQNKVDRKHYKSNEIFK